MPELVRIAPEIPVTSLDEAIDHYEKRLGFQTTMTLPDRDYAIVERDGVAIHLFENASGKHSPVSVHVFTHGLDELFAELEGRGAQVTQTIARKAWGNRDFRIADPSGNEIKFTEPLADDA